MHILCFTIGLNLFSIVLKVIIFHLSKELWILMSGILLGYDFSSQKDSSIVKHTKSKVKSF